MYLAIFGAVVLVVVLALVWAENDDDTPSGDFE